MTKNEFTELARSFQGAESTPHFDRIGFRIVHKRMFATYLEKDNSANLFLSVEEQKAFCEINPAIFPVPNKWGEKGATTFLLDNVPEEIIVEALQSAYNSVLASKK